MEDTKLLVFCVASYSGLGDVLMLDRNVITYFLRELKPYERNYPTNDVELATVVFAVMILGHYLNGVK